MVIGASNSTPLPRLGELFVEAGLLNAKVVSDCLYTAQRTQIPVGKALVLAGHVSQPDVESALQTQELLRAGTVNRQSALKLVRRAYCTKISVEEAQAQELCDHAFSMPFSLTGKLLMAAQILSQQVLLTATRKTTQQLPLGRLLVTENLISQDLLINVMNCLILIRDKKISKYQAVDLLRHLSNHYSRSLPDALKNRGLKHLIGNDTPRLLDLLTSAGLLSKIDANWCLEISVETGRQTGQVLLLYGLVDERFLDSALALQQMLSTGTLSLSRASELLILCKEADTSLESLLAELNHMNLVVKFLRRSRMLNEELVSRIAAQTADFESTCGSVLVREGVVGHELLIEAMRLLAEVQNGSMTEEQAVNAIRANADSSSFSREARPAINFEISASKRLERTA